MEQPSWMLSQNYPRPSTSQPTTNFKQQSIISTFIERPITREQQRTMTQQNSTASSFHTNKKNQFKSLNDFEIAGQLGKGGSSIVLRVLSKKTGEEFVCKKINLLGISNAKKQDILKEVDILKRVQNSIYFIQYQTSFIDDNCLCIIMEYAKYSDLQKLIRRNKQTNTYFPETFI